MARPDNLGTRIRLMHIFSDTMDELSGISNSLNMGDTHHLWDGLRA